MLFLIRSCITIYRFNGTSLFTENSTLLLTDYTLAEKRVNEKGSSGNWKSAIKLLKSYDPDIVFEDLDKSWVEGWKEYLQKKANAGNGRALKQNTKVSYFSKTVAAIKEAKMDGILKENPSESVKPISPEESQKEFLTDEELQLLINTECELPLLRHAFLFSCLTGLRWSDIKQLKWRDIQFSQDLGYFVSIRQEKTNDLGTIPIAVKAVELIGGPRDEDNLIFADLKYSAWTNLKLQQWVMKAGISKKITFHCSRHTFATLLLTKGTDITVVQALLMHKSIKNTQVYGKIINPRKKDAVDKLQFNFP